MLTNILNTNIYDPRLGDKLLIIGTCIPAIQRKVFEDFEKRWKNVFAICLEQDHYNQLHSKLAAIIGTGRVNEIGFLTVDGSPHCVQVHYVSKYLNRELKNKINFFHYVVNEKGEVFEVDMKSIDESKRLEKVGKKV